MIIFRIYFKNVLGLLDVLHFCVLLINYCYWFFFLAQIMDEYRFSDAATSPSPFLYDKVCHKSLHNTLTCNLE